MYFNKVQNLYNMLLRYLIGFENYGRRLGVNIGTGCRIYTHHFGSEPFLISIGNYCTISNGTRFITHDGSYWIFRKKYPRSAFKFGKITIGDNVFVGMNVIIMPGISIGENSIIGAGAIVTKSVPANSIVVGIPARIIGTTRKIEEKIIAQKDIYPEGFEFYSSKEKKKFFENEIF